MHIFEIDAPLYSKGAVFQGASGVRFMITESANLVVESSKGLGGSGLIKAHWDYWCTTVSSEGRSGARYISEVELTGMEELHVWSEFL